MSQASRSTEVFHHIMTSVRVMIVTMAVCCLLYGLALLSFGQGVMPYRAQGSLLRNGQGEILGSELIAQGFSRPEYFWSRPSAVEYNGSAAGGCNWSPTNPELGARAKTIMAKMGVTTDNPLPADLATASGSGLDPHITLRGALYQAERVASARGLSLAAVKKLLERHAKRPGGLLTPEPLVNVLLLNVALDRGDT
jgi:potassium-transporting ATPase KdpC subunit